MISFPKRYRAWAVCLTGRGMIHWLNWRYSVYFILLSSYPKRANNVKLLQRITDQNETIYLFMDMKNGGKQRWVKEIMNITIHGYGSTWTPSVPPWPVHYLHSILRTRIVLRHLCLTKRVKATDQAICYSTRVSGGFTAKALLRIRNWWKGSVAKANGPPVR